MTTITENTYGANWLKTFAHTFKNHRLIQILSGLLVVQILIAAIIGLQGLGTGTVDNPEPLFSFAKEEVTELEVSDASQTLHLLKQGDSWAMGPDKNLPVDNSRIAMLLSSLENLNVGLPVASSKNAQAQLAVADDDYQRKLSINAGDTKTTLLLGTSPGIRKSHIRIEGSDNIHSASLPVSDVSASVDSWLDKSLLAVTGITKISSDDVTFELRAEGDDKTWSMVESNGNGESIEFDADKLTGIVDALENLQVEGVGEELQPGTTPLTDQNQDSSAEDTDSSSDGLNELTNLEVLLSTESNEITLHLQRLGDKATVQRSDTDGFYTIPTTLFERLSLLGSNSEWEIKQSDQDSGQPDLESGDSR